MENEKRLIDANALEQHCKNTKIIELFPEWKDFHYAIKIALKRYGKAWKEIIQNTPTVDAVEVVRCKDCTHREGGLCPMEAIGEYPWNATKDDDFCSYGERRTNETV